ncbi:unnamed protein product [Porites evermanni]|uniref:Mediator of RNA polymerase II transcription subunit 22 n=1 Tax=Porites evermanni TaxID=104178 RepID=A0ABN8QV25_9CNID|nr:unnamed protein product [Porites evermanni]
MLCGPCSAQNGGIVVIVGDQIDACSFTRNKSKMSQPNRILPQSKETLLKSYTKRLKDDVKSILDNFTEIVKSSKVESETQVSRLTQSTQDQYEVNVRAANIVRAGESLQKLVSDMKEFLILNDFPSVNTSITERIRKSAIRQINNF